MVHTLKIGGKVRTVLFGSLAIKKLSEECGLTLGQIGEALSRRDMAIVPDALYCALRAGEQYDKVAEKDDYSADDVAIWIDTDSEPGAMGKAIEWLSESIENMFPDDAPDEAKKKKQRK